MNRPVSISLLFAIVSGIYWWLVGQFLPIIVPMMLNDGAMLSRVLLQAVLALAVYVCGATVFFRWLLSRSKAD